MVSSLQEQLAVIASKTTNQLDLKAQAKLHSKSLIFDARTASKQDFDSLFQICFEGFEELCALDSRFNQFRSNLFSPHSKSQNRAQLTEKENASLDVVIETFLSFVSAKLLIAPALKATEWLIRRFQAHEYNYKSLVLAFLPYHDNKSSLFTSLLVILPVSKLTQAFKFLYPYIKAESNPPAKVIVYTLAHEPTFFGAFNEFYLRMFKTKSHSSTLISFWSYMTLQSILTILDETLAGRKDVYLQKQEDAVIRILSILEQGFSVTNEEEVSIACLAITMVLCAKGNLSNEVVDGLMTTIMSIRGLSSGDEKLTCLVMLAQCRPSSDIPQSAVKKLLKQDSTFRALKTLSTQTKVDRLLNALVLEMLSSQKIQTETILEAAATAVIALDESKLIQALHLATKHAQSKTVSVPQSKICVQFAYETLKLKGSLSSQLAEKVGITEEELEKITGAPVASKAAPVIQPNARIVQSTSANFTELLKKVLPSQERSFLSLLMNATFEPLHRLFEQAVEDSSKMSEFYNASVFQRDGELDELRLVSFLARASLSGTVSGNLGAIELLRFWVNGASSPGPKVQALIPVLLIHLSASAKSIRTAAISVLSELITPLNSSGEAWTYEELYGTTIANLSAVPGSEIALFLKDILLSHAEIIALDCTQASALISSTFEGATTISVTKNGKSSKSKSNPISSFYTFIISHTVATPILRTRLALLHILQRSVLKSKNKVKGIAPLVFSIQAWAARPTEDVHQLAQTWGVDVVEMNTAYFSSLSPNDVDAMSFLLGVITNLSALRSDISRAAIDFLIRIWRSLGSSLRETFTKALLQVASDKKPQADTARPLAIEALHAVPLSTQSLLTLVESLPRASDLQLDVPNGKRRRISHTENVRDGASGPTTVVEILASYDLALGLIQKSAPLSDPNIMSGLFNLLEELQKLSTKADSNLMYLQSITLSCLLDVVKSLREINGFKIDVKLIRTDLLVDCVRQAHNSQVLSSALLLISSFASWVPEIVLHGVMPIFAFIGNTILRQDDDFSEHVVNEALAHIVPPLVSSLQAKKQDVVSGVSELLTSFTTALEHIPSHRRLDLFNTLAKTLGPSECLYAIALILAQRYSTDDDVLRFVVSLLEKAGTEVTVITIKQYINSVFDLALNRKGPSSSLIQLEDKSRDDAEKLLSSLVNFLASIINKDAIRLRIIRHLRRSTEADDSVRTELFACLEGLVELSIGCKETSLVRPCHNSLSAAFRLLPPNDLLRVANDLFLFSDNEKAVESLPIFLQSLNVRVRRIKNAERSDVLAYVSLLPGLTNIVSTGALSTKTSAILCIDGIVQKFGKANTQPVAGTLEVLSGKDALGHKDETIRIASIYCLSSCAEIVKEQFIPVLPTVFPIVAKYATERATRETELFSSSFWLINNLCEGIPFMFSGQYLEKSLGLVFASTRYPLTAEEQEVRQQFLEVVVLSIDPSEAFRASGRSFSSALSSGPAGVILHLKAIQMLLQRHSNATVLKQTGTLFPLLRQLLTVRPEFVREGVEETEIVKVEGWVIDTILATVLKLNDGVFRPFFSTLISWARSESKDAAEAQGRGITLFRFAEAMFARLKSLVTSYSTDVLDFAVELLQTAPVGDTLASTDLAAAVLSALSQSFQHDQADFWQTPTHFSQLAGPLVGLLERAGQSKASAGATTSAGASLVDEHLLGAIVEFATVANSSDHHKELNGLLMRGMRARSAPAVRLHAVKCQRRLTERLGEEWMTLLPELLPVIGELQEDEDERVELETLKWIRVSEKILGESMDSMLR